MSKRRNGACSIGSGTGAGESILRFTTDPGGSVGGGGSPGTPMVNVLPYAVANSAATLTIPPDSASLAWHARLSGSGPLAVCTLAR